MQLCRVAFLLLSVRHLDWQLGMALSLALEPAPLLGCAEHSWQLEELTYCEGGHFSAVT